MKKIFDWFLKKKSLTSIEKIEVITNEQAEKALGGFREYVPPIYEAKNRDGTWGNTAILLDSMK